MSLFGGANDWFYWGLFVFLGLPLSVIVLGEISQRVAGSRYAHLCKPLDLFRTSALFLLFVTLLLRHVMSLPDDNIAVMVIHTLLWTSVLNAALALMNALLFEGDESIGRRKLPNFLLIWDACSSWRSGRQSSSAMSGRLT